MIKNKTLPFLLLLFFLPSLLFLVYFHWLTGSGMEKPQAQNILAQVAEWNSKSRWRRTECRDAGTGHARTPALPARIAALPARIAALPARIAALPRRTHENPLPQAQEPCKQHHAPPSWWKKAAPRTAELVKASWSFNLSVLVDRDKAFHRFWSEHSLYWLHGHQAGGPSLGPDSKKQVTNLQSNEMPRPSKAPLSFLYPFLVAIRS